MNFKWRCLDFVCLRLFPIISFTAVIAIVYVQRAINLERKGCHVLVTTRDKKLSNHIAHAMEDT